MRVNNYNKQVNAILYHLAERVHGEAEKGEAVDIYFYILVLCNKDSQILPKQQQKPINENVADLIVSITVRKWS